MAVNYVEVKGRLGVFGWISRILFWGWQIIMLAWAYGFTSQAATIVSESQSEAYKAGASVGVFIGWGLILFFWVGGSVILGLFALMTRPARMLVQAER